MEKSKLIKLLIVIFVVILLIILIILGRKIFLPKLPPNEVLIKNDYKLERDYKVSESTDEILLSNYDFVKYSKNGVSIYIFDYKEYELAKENVLEAYEKEKNSKIDNYLRETRNYVLKKRCDSMMCDYQVAFKNYLIAALEEVQNSDEVETLLSEIVGRKLKFE